MFRFVFAVGGNTAVRLELLLSVAVLLMYLLNLHSVVNKVVFTWNVSISITSVKRL
jgi:hypothetical protein